MTSDRAILSLPLAEIAEGEHVGLIDAAAIDCLAARFAVEGQVVPVMVRRNGNRAARPWTLVAGRHRMLAAARLGWAAIDAIACADATSDAAAIERIQVAENLDRRVLHPIERAVFLMRRWREAEAATPLIPANASQQRTAAKARWVGVGKPEDISPENIGLAASATVADTGAIDTKVADGSGCSARTVESYRAIFTAIVGELPDLFAELNAHPLGESLSAVQRLAKLNPTARRHAAVTVLSSTEWPSIDAALVAAGLSTDKGARPDKHDRLRASFSGSFERMKLADQRGAVKWLAGTVTPGMAASMIETFWERGFIA